MRKSPRAPAGARAGAGIDVAVTVRSGPGAAAVSRWAALLVAGARVPPGRGGPVLSVLLCGDARMQGLNREWRGMDRPTDVLSFPSGEAGFLGDLVIDVPYAARQARRLGHPLAREVQLLLAHGLLHLLGHDHETDGGQMFRRQRRLVLGTFGPGPDGVPEDEP